jgi:aspartate-semialdehyde dehydrogenase
MAVKLPPAQRIPVAVAGATGLVGQRFVALLAEHPWFRPTVVTGSARSVGRRYREAADWRLASPLPAAVGELVVADNAAAADCRLVFSALDADVALEVERSLAAAGAFVVSNARSHRMHPRVPLLVPEVNPDHLGLLDAQDFGGGAIVTNPNCSTIGLVLALRPLADAFGVARANVVTMQALSGAGLAGPSALAMLDNLVPFIGGEEEKIETETRKILGLLEGDEIREADVTISAQCNRVGVVDGHVACVSVELEREASAEAIIEAWREFRAAPQELSLPSAPLQPLHYLEAHDAPQPRLHRDLDRGMATAIGRLRPCPVFDWRFVALSHNTVRGAAGGAILVAELAVAQGRLG